MDVSLSLPFFTAHSAQCTVYTQTRKGKKKKKKILLVFNELEVLKLATGGSVSGSPAPRALLHAFFMAIFSFFFFLLAISLSLSQCSLI